MCVDVADVIASVNFGRENSLLVVIRGGGHNGGGLGLCDDGLVIDLSGLKFVRVDTSNKTLRVGGGNIWGEVDQRNTSFWVSGSCWYYFNYRCWRINTWWRSWTFIKKIRINY